MAARIQVGRRAYGHAVSLQWRFYRGALPARTRRARRPPLPGWVHNPFDCMQPRNPLSLLVVALTAPGALVRPLPRGHVDLAGKGGTEARDAPHFCQRLPSREERGEAPGGAALLGSQRGAVANPLLWDGRPPAVAPASECCR